MSIYPFSVNNQLLDFIKDVDASFQHFWKSSVWYLVELSIKIRDASNSLFTYLSIVLQSNVLRYDNCLEYNYFSHISFSIRMHLNLYFQCLIFIT